MSRNLYLALPLFLALTSSAGAGVGGDLDGDGKPNETDECTTLVAEQSLEGAILQIKAIDEAPGEHVLLLKGKFRPAGSPNVQPDDDGLHLFIEDGGGAVLDLNVPGGIIGSSPSTPCDPRDGWLAKPSAKSTTFQYRNFSGFLDAACSVSANGLSSIKLQDMTEARGIVKFVVKLSSGTFPVALPPTSILAGVALAAEPTPGTASAAAQSGACGEFAWDPVEIGPPLPFCRLSPPMGPTTKVRCRGAQ